MSKARSGATAGSRGRRGTLPDPVVHSLESTPRADLLSDVLSALRVGSSALCVFDLREPWGVQIDELPLSVSWTVMEGTVWLRTAGRAATALHRGDTFMLPHGICQQPYILASSADEKPVMARDVWRQAELRGFEPGAYTRGPQHVRWGGSGGIACVVSTAFFFHDPQLSPLIAALPELMVVRTSETDSEGEFINQLLQFALSTEGTGFPGFSALAIQTAQLLLGLVVRAYAVSQGKDSLGWLAGLGSPHIARALDCIHRKPESAWTVAALARIAGLSRSVFAERFLTRVGQTPMQYLCAWRMHLAREALAAGKVTVTTLAKDLGYQSEAAFRAAFRRMTGQPPSEFRRDCGSQLDRVAS